MLPTWLDFVGDENAAAAMFRNLRAAPAKWGELIASAQAVMGVFQDNLDEPPERLHDEQEALPLVAAARILDAASQPPAGLPEAHRGGLALAAAVAFGMHGNFVSAYAVVQRSVKGALQITPPCAIIMATAAPSLIVEMMPFCGQDSAELGFLERLAHFLRSGDTDEAQPLRDALIECLLHPSPSASGEPSSSLEGALLRSCRICLEQVICLSLARALREHAPAISALHLKKLLDGGVRVLLPPQLKAIAHHRLVSQSENAILALPTSTGKTLLGELCIAASLAQGPGLACYLVPYVALGGQVYDSLRSHLPRAFRIQRMIGGYRAPERLAPDARKEVIVATPERLDGLLRTAPEAAAHLRCVVVDEAHMVQNDTRGVILEGVLTRLLMRPQENKVRLVLLSAVLSQYDRLQAWMGVPDDMVISDSWKPTARRLAFWEQTGRLVYRLGNDPVRRPETPNEAVLGTTTIPWPKARFYPAGNKGFYDKQAPDLFSNVAYLAESLYKDYGELILCFCPRPIFRTPVSAARAEVFGIKSQPSGSGANTWANSCVGVGNRNCRRMLLCAGVKRVACTAPPNCVRRSISP